MIDFLKLNDEISDEMLAAYIDGNATEEERSLIENSFGSDEMLSEVVDVVNDINSVENENCDWPLLDNGEESIYGFEYPHSYHPEDMMVAAIQEPLELNIETPPLDIPDDIDNGDDGMDDLFDL